MSAHPAMYAHQLSHRAAKRLAREQSMLSLRRDMDDVVSQMFSVHPHHAHSHNVALLNDPFFDAANVAAAMPTFYFLDQQPAAVDSTPAAAATAATPASSTSSSSSSSLATSTPATNTNTALSSSSTSPHSHWPATFGANVHIDVHEDDKHFTLTAELPGVPKDAVHVHVEDGYLTISGEKKESYDYDSTKVAPAAAAAAPAAAAAAASTSTSSSSSSAAAPAAPAAPTTNNRVVRRSERRYGSFNRSFRLPAACDADASHITAKYEHGILQLDIPKVQAQPKPTKFNVAIL